MVKKILFIAAHRLDRAPGQRYRFEQYFSFLAQNGFQCHLSPIITERDDKVFYKPGKYWQKFRIARRAWFKRLADVRAAKDYDIIFIFREAFFTGGAYFEKQFKKSGKKLVFDFDDSIWMLDISGANAGLSWLKNPGKTARIISMSDLSIAGNNYLADYAGRYCENVIVIPTTVDTDEYRPVAHREPSDRITIGWTGSHTTIKHFEIAVPVLLRIKEKYGDYVQFTVLGDPDYTNPLLGIKGIAWSKERELSELNKMDIGIMPLPDDEWSKGKCGLKGLVYMSMEIPAVMSPVGVNTEIIKHNINGKLASSADDWVNALSELIESEQLRKKLGKAGRETVIEGYSVLAHRHTYLNALRTLVQ